MTHISIVAREDFISVVTDAYEETILVPERFKIREIIPNTAYFTFSGDPEYAEMAVNGAETLIGQGFSLAEIAESLQAVFSSEAMSFQQSGKHFEAVIAGYSQDGAAQFHIISNSQYLESFYPGTDESLYYANAPAAMHALEKMLIMHGMATASQAQRAQLHLLEEAAKTLPNVSSQAAKLVIKRSH